MRPNQFQQGPFLGKIRFVICMSKGVWRSYSAQQVSIRETKTGEVFCGIESRLFWKATAPTT